MLGLVIGKALPVLPPSAHAKPALENQKNRRPSRNRLRYGLRRPWPGIGSHNTARVVFAAGVGAGVAVGVAASDGWGQLSTGMGPALAGWVTGALVYLVWTWARVWPMNSEETKAHARVEDRTRRITHGIVFLASAASLVGVGHLLINDSESVAEAIVAAASVFAARAMVHTVFALNYARLYYAASSDDDISFDQDQKPAYCDFAYFAFTIGMSYAVSDPAAQLTYRQDYTAATYFRPMRSARHPCRVAGRLL
jgi:uncharacterized membrane protein